VGKPWSLPRALDDPRLSDTGTVREDGAGDGGILVGHERGGRPVFFASSLDRRRRFSVVSGTVRERLLALLEPEVERMGYELVELECMLHRRGGVVRLYIDAPQGVGLEDCERVSVAVSALLDVEDPIAGSYRLEVSSPGFDRPLRRAADFDRHLGREIRVDLAVADERGRGRLRGRLETTDAESLTLVTATGEAVRVARAAVARARLVPRAEDYVMGKSTS
jgi:ribosome maturation factor RimP